MLDKSQRFFDHLDRLVESGEEFGLGELTTNLAFDVIGEQHCKHLEVSLFLASELRHVFTRNYHLRLRSQGSDPWRTEPCPYRISRMSGGVPHTQILQGLPEMVDGQTCQRQVQEIG